MANRVLVTNDDGIDGEGLRVLVAALVGEGYDPLVVAPDRDYSGAGTSILGLAFEERPEIRYEQRTLPEAPDAEAYAIGGPPALCVLLAGRGAFGDMPELVVSGINYGLNTGAAVRHSGTVGAAMTAVGFDVPALAVSAEHSADESKPMRYDTAAAVAMQLLREVPHTSHSVLNLNVPGCDLSELAGVRSAPLATVSRYRSVPESRENGRIVLSYRINDVPVRADTDTGLVEAGYAAVTSLTGVGWVDCTDLVLRLGEAAA